MHQYKNVHITGGFNMTIYNPYQDNLLKPFGLATLIHTPTCSQSYNSTCKDHSLTNGKALLEFSKTFETGFSNHHKLILTVKYKYFVLEIFTINLNGKLKEVIHVLNLGKH